jgi:hypothetical protein
VTVLDSLAAEIVTLGTDQTVGCMCLNVSFLGANPAQLGDAGIGREILSVERHAGF